MRQQFTWGRRTFTSVLAIGVAAGVTFSGALPAAAAPGADAPAELLKSAETPAAPKEAPADTLGAHDAELLAKAEAANKKFVTVIVAAEAGKSADVAAKIKALGGVVTRHFDEIGYVLASVPIAKVVAAAKLTGVKAVDLEETMKLPETGQKDKSGKPAQLAAPGPTTPAANPYLPTDETGSVDFKKKFPKYDGRGVTIGIMDSGVDIDHPALAKTTTGERKIVDWVTATDPLLENDGTWRAMLTSVSGPTFTYANQTWKAPAGNWQINRFAESITAASEPAGDVNRDGDTTDTWGILYDPVSHDIRVDTNQNFDFTDDAVMRPYKEKFDVNHFGTDNPATPIAERMPFVVEYREDVDLTPAGIDGTADFVNIGIPEGLHASHVAGIAAGNDLFGNAAFDGQAPGAKIVSARACSWGGGCTNAALTTGMADLVINRGVDVVNMSIGGLPALNDGSNAQAQLYNQLITKYGVQLFVSAGNSGPGVNTHGEPSGSTEVVSVAASISDDTWKSNYGAETRKPLQLFPFSSRGPREDGGFKPNISAPGSAVSLSPTWENVAGLTTVPYTLPPGYSMQNGTSMASPQAAGGAALLLSAAKANGFKVTPPALRRAIYSSADSIPGEQTYEQGYGQMNVPDAWKLLAKKPATRTYTSSAPVCTPLSDLLATPGQGTGIYNRCAAADGGLKAGQVKVQTIKLTRTSGPAYPVLHTLTWQGDRSSFVSSPVVLLPLNKTVSVPVVVRAKEGVASAILKVDDPATPVIDFEVLNTVVTGVDTKKPSYATSFSGQVDRASTTSYFVTVPEGTKALQVDLSGIASGSQTRWIAINPWGVPAEDTASALCFTNYSDPATCKPEERSYENPIPGIWEIEVEARRTSPVVSNPFKVTAKIQGVTLTPETVTLPSVTVNQPAPVSFTVKNNFGPVTVSAQGGPLGSASSQRPSIAEGASQEHAFAVPAGSTRLTVAIGNTSDATADLDLSLYRDGVLVGQDADGDSEESITLTNPAAGNYTAVVDGYAVPAGTTEFDYLDIYFSPALGTVTVPSTPITLANGASTTVSGTVTALSVPPAGRALSGEVTIVTDEGAIVGRGPIAITAVTG
ncbi:S8 family serine peptidase [Paractinoplanes lichenicola]|uniref:S8 family serine peptidase n=1 Tax=Paractinoplanes lichenicola TaxID=2802976 RepID=A0ABS1VIR5_9ACTN|nr:S8 family serine peptidase [Actinoplanes lichenicola]MBL7254540.1 S8 family serine peptidase [Actinoplanes lichenicola]